MPWAKTSAVLIVSLAAVCLLSRLAWGPESVLPNGLMFLAGFCGGLAASIGLKRLCGLAPGEPLTWAAFEEGLDRFLLRHLPGYMLANEGLLWGLFVLAGFAFGGALLGAAVLLSRLAAALQSLG